MKWALVAPEMVGRIAVRGTPLPRGREHRRDRLGHDVALPYVHDALEPAPAPQPHSQGPSLDAERELHLVAVVPEGG